MWKQAEESIVAETPAAVKEEPVVFDKSTMGPTIHRDCITNPVWLRECPSCKRKTITAWSGTIASAAAVVATIDLSTESDQGGGDA